MFRVLIPEYDLANPGHRADLLIFRDGTSQNVEVEWTTSRFNHGPQVAATHYANDSGFVMALQDDRAKAKSYTAGLDIVEINPEEFFWWFAKNAIRLIGATIAVQTERNRPRERKHRVIYEGKLGEAEPGS